MLRSGTRSAHERVDQAFSAFNLADPAAYGRFLAAQAMAFLPVEAALDAAGAAKLLPDWPQRRRADLLRADLAALGLGLPTPLDPPAFATPAAVAGGAYVLEGSRLGGALLARSVPAGLPQGFLRAPQRPGQWRDFLALLEEHLPSPALREEATASAAQTFDRFASAAKRATMTP